MRYKIVPHKSGEEYGVSCPGLPGCWPQGATESEALENVRDATREYLAAGDALFRDTPDVEVREIVQDAKLTIEAFRSSGDDGPFRRWVGGG